MRTKRDRVIRKGTVIALLMIVLIVGWKRASSGGMIPPSPNGAVEVSILLNQWSQITREEAFLKKATREATRAATRPYAEYLLYQRSLRFAEHDARLEELKKEKRGIIARLAPLERGAGRFSALPPGTTGGSIERGPPTYSAYSGAPPYSFYDATQFDPASPPGFSPIEIHLLRLLFSTAALLIFALPPAALKRYMADRREKAIIRLFPIFVVRREDLRRELLRTSVKRADLKGLKKQVVSLKEGGAR